MTRLPYSLTQRNEEELISLHASLSDEHQLKRQLKEFLSAVELMCIGDRRSFDDYVRDEAHYCLENICGWKWQNNKFSKDGENLTRKQYDSALRLIKMVFVRQAISMLEMKGYKDHETLVEHPGLKHPFSLQGDLMFYYNLARDSANLIDLARQF